MTAEGLCHLYAEGGNREQLLSSFLVAQNSGVVFHQTGGEMMGPVFFSDEIQIGCGGWVQHSLNRFSPGIAYGTGGQASPSVSVIGSVSLKMSSGKVAIEIFESIDHRGIALKPNPFLESI